MTRPDQRTGVDEFLARLRDRTADGVYTIALEHGELPVWVRLQDSPSVVFTFTGAANRDRPLPQFASTGLAKQIPATIVALADPSLERNEEMRLGWYAGHEGFELQKILPDLIQQFIDRLGATRAAFVGGSGGGFAALYYSAKIPGSVAVVLNPQTNLNRYHWGHQRRYRSICWPSMEEKAPLDSAISANLIPVYSELPANTVICIQIASDYFHLTRQFSPFVAALPPEYRDQLIVRVANWGVEGHKPAPTTVWIPWVRAALSAPDISAASIEETWAEQNPFQPRPMMPSARASNGSAPPAAAPAKSADFEYPIRRTFQDAVAQPTNRDEQIAAALAGAAAGRLFGAHTTPDDGA